MTEIYTISVDGSGVAFSPRGGDVPEFARTAVFDPAKAPGGLSLVCRMGTPDLAHCVIFREDGRPGGLFVMHEQGELLFAAVAETNLAYVLAKGFFGELTASARFGVDIFESSEDADD